MGADGDPTVLIVEDEPAVGQVFAEQLDDAYTVRAAAGGEEALATLDADVDVVLLDRRMPGLSGDDVLAELRDREMDCQVVIVTAVKPDFDIIDMPFDDYVVKPVSKEELHHTVDRMLARTEYHDLVREYFTLLSKHAALKTHKNADELEASDDFARLEAELEAVRNRLDRTVAKFEARDYNCIFRDIT